MQAGIHYITITSSNQANRSFMNSIGRSMYSQWEHVS